RSGCTCSSPSWAWSGGTSPRRRWSWSCRSCWCSCCSSAGSSPGSPWAPCGRPGAGREEEAVTSRPDGARGRRYLRAARVVTAGPSGTIADGAVVIEGSRIAAVGPAAGLLAGAPPDAVEAFPDGTLLPGLVDAHAHLTLAADRRTYEQMVLDP